MGGHTCWPRLMHSSHLQKQFLDCCRYDDSWGAFDLQMLQHMHPLGLADDWADKLSNEQFFSANARATFEHYMQVGLRAAGLHDKDQAAICQGT